VCVKLRTQNHDASLLPLDVAPSDVFSAVVALADVSILSFFCSLPVSSAGASVLAARLLEGWSADVSLADFWSAFVSPAAVLDASVSCDVVVPDEDEPAASFESSAEGGLVTGLSGSSGLS